MGDSCPSGTSSFCQAGTGKEAGKTPSGTQCYICVTDECPTGLVKSCSSDSTAEEAGQTGKGTPCYKCFEQTCAPGTSLTCAAGEVAIPKGQNAEGKTCYQCLKDECPSGSFLNCGNGFNPVEADKTPSGKQCFHCEPMMSTTQYETTQYETTSGNCDSTYDYYIEQAKQYCHNKGSYLMTVEGLGCSYNISNGIIITGMSCSAVGGINRKYVVGTYSTEHSYAEHAGCDGLWIVYNGFLQFYGESRPDFSELLCASDLSAITTNETTTAEITSNVTTTYETTTYETTTYDDGYKCPGNRPLIGGNDLCYPCDVYEQISYSSDVDCSKCPGLVKVNNYNCVAADCTNKPLQTAEGCYTCDAPQAVYAKNCSICGNQRVEVNGRCYLKTSCGVNTFETKDGLCHRCDTENVNLQTTATACSNCGGQRVYSSEGYCCKACPSGYVLGDYCGCMKVKS